MNASRVVHKQQTGFSLVELLVVVGLIVLLAAFAIPSIATFVRNYRIRGAAQQVASEIQAARTKAIMKNTNLGVVFLATSATQYRFVLEDVPLAANPNTRETLADLTAPPLEAGQAGPVRSLPFGVQFAVDAATCPISAGFTPNNPGFRFDRLGRRCDPGASGDCPALDIGTDVAMAAAATGSTVCVFETQSGLSRLVRVAPGGRVITLP